ncbi:MAG: hypothetical protein JXA68_08300 [Ignavibacteriales bacterium]|nr:hypothetical protein [Ignavibacteriales bacterium]
MQKKNFVQHAIVTVSDSLKVTGKLLDENDSILSIAIDGVLKDYLKSEIKSYEIVMMPDERLMMEDINDNSRRTAIHTGFFFLTAIIGIVIGVLVYSGK